MARRVFLIELAGLSPDESLEIFRFLDEQNIKSDTILGWSEGSEIIKVFWDSDEDFFSLISLPENAICSDITDNDFF